MNEQENCTREIQAELRLAAIWQARGRVERALQGYRRVLEKQPDNVTAQQNLGDLMCLHKRLPEALAVYQHALEQHPNEARLHRGLTNALAQQDGLEAAFAFYALERMDTRTVEVEPQEVLCCVVVRNEALRLPFFLEYYRAQGLTKFFVVDNGSTDETLAFLRAQRDVYVWRSTLSFKRANFGSAWFQVLLRRYGVNHWWLMVDADELLYYPDCERINLPQVCRALERQGKKALNAVLLDMYSDLPIRETHYEQGQDFRETCVYFDRTFYAHQYADAGPYRNQTGFTGGMRLRAFGEQDRFYLSKAPLLYYDASVVLAGGQHWTSHANAEIAEMRACLLHFKYFSTFPAYVEEQVTRNEHADNAFQYKQYAQALAENPALTLYDAAQSVKLENSAQLVELGIMQGNIAADTVPPVLFPRIPSRREDAARPFWSVLLTTYDRTEYLEGALASVLAQAPAADEMQIAVLNDGAAPEIQQQLERIVKACGGGRAEFYVTRQNVGQPEIFNLCIEQARGTWIHILHDDDWVEQGFYAALRKGIERASLAGAAFCRQQRHSGKGALLGLSWLERETPGMIDGWLERIAVDSRLQPSSMVVKRAVYEAVGGYCAAGGSAFDWEMWKRIAVHFPVWYEPQPLAHFRQHRGALSYELQRTGAQIANSRKAIEISQGYLPAAVRETLTRRAYRNYALYALRQAREFLPAGDADAALANLREGLLCSQTPEIQSELVALLTEVLSFGRE